MKKIIITTFSIFILAIGVRSQSPFIDQTFFNDFGISSEIIEVKECFELEDNRIFIYGDLYDSLYSNSSMAMLYADGSVDTSFSGTFDVYGTLAHVYDTSIFYGRYELQRFNFKGEVVDSAWSDQLEMIPGHSNSDFRCMHTIVADTLLVGLGDVTTQLSEPLVKVSSGGVVDTTFITGLIGDVDDIKEYLDDKLILFGRFFTSEDSTSRRLALVDKNGNLDTTFQASSDIHKMYGVGVQSDGKIICGGVLNLNETKYSLFRLNTDGSLDNTFMFRQLTKTNPEYLRAIYVTPDDGCLVGGITNDVEGYCRRNIVKLDADGFIEPYFFSNTCNDTHANGFPQHSWTIIKGRGDYLWFGSDLTSLDGTPVNGLIKIKLQSIGAEEVKVADRIKVFPVPSSNQITVSGLKRSVMFDVFSIHGKIIESKSFGSGTEDVTISCSDWPAGIYCIRIIHKNQSMETKRITVVH